MKKPMFTPTNIMAKIFKGPNKYEIPMKLRNPTKSSSLETDRFPVERRETQVVEGNNLEEKVMQILTNSSKDTMKKILTLGELSLPQPQFKAFRKEIFDLFGTREFKRVARVIVSECLSSNRDKFGQGRRF
ncbi:MAG: hypothetical protein HXY44_12220 [Syntrophaceae bacterium]|nr:hypothetical protein [Syntrophaceae bacterium]